MLAAPQDSSADDSADEDKPPRKGHGRRPAEEYTGAKHVKLAHRWLSSGQSCPHCVAGKIYTQCEPGVLVRIVGQGGVQPPQCGGERGVRYHHARPDRAE